MTRETKNTVLPQDLTDMLTTAFEGGSNYWVNGVQLNGVWPDSFTYVSEALEHGMSVTIIHDDPEDPVEMAQSLLKPAKLIKAIAEFAAKNKRTVEDLMDSFDADDADDILQLALFGKAIFG